jgi:hypothetical protein
MPFGLSVSILPSDLPLNGFACGVPGEVALPDLTLQGSPVGPTVIRSPAVEDADVEPHAPQRLGGAAPRDGAEAPLEVNPGNQLSRRCAT